MQLRKYFINACFLLILCTAVRGQSPEIDSLKVFFHRQLLAYPQEKIYLHTDKPYYLNGEKIWFRAHLVDAVLHRQATASRYVYVELINPLDSLITRVKIRPDEEAFSGYIDLPDDLPEGGYTLRAYTNFMCSMSEDYFCSKSVYIGDPQSQLIHADVQFEFPAKNVDATIRFSQDGFSGNVVPEKVRMRVNQGRFSNLKADADNAFRVRLPMPAKDPRRVMMLDIQIVGKPFRKFFHIPVPADDFDVAFFPEGGNLISGCLQKVAFKAMRSDGAWTHVSGTIFDQSGEEIVQMEDLHQGMGSVAFIPRAGKSYYALCTGGPVSKKKRFDLPKLREGAPMLSAQWIKNRLYVSTLNPEGTPLPDTLYLLAHTRGSLQYIDRWDNSQSSVLIPTDQIRSGVLHLLLLNSRMMPVSERLVFVGNDDVQALAAYSADKENYERRSLVSNKVTLTDPAGSPLSGNFSVSVTDDGEVVADSVNNIMTHLLLCSDLRGHVTDPGYYFRGPPNSRVQELDVLMMTQGWRRYNIAQVTQGRIEFPSTFLEAGFEISGTVRDLSNKTVEKAVVTVIALNGMYFDMQETDKDGRFYFSGFELPAGIKFLVDSKFGDTKKKALLEVFPDKEVFPETKGKRIADVLPVDNKTFVRYVEKAELKYSYENGIRVYLLDEVVVTAKRKYVFNQPVGKPEYIMNEEQIEALDKEYIGELFEVALKGIISLDGETYTRYKRSLDIYINGTELGFFQTPIDQLFKPSDIKRIEFYKGIMDTEVISIETRKELSAVFASSSSVRNIRRITPLGYQLPAEFYAPKYDTPEAKENQTPDLRTTIHWQPNVKTDENGVATFDFYTADAPTTYTVVMEGLASNGMIIRQEEKIERRAE